MRTLLRRGRHGEGTVARQFLVLQVLVVVVLVGSALALATLDARRDTRDRAREQAIAVARSIADSPAVRDALHTADPSTTLQPYAEAVRADADVDFVVVMAPDRTRYTHPDPARIGGRFVGDLGGALQGKVFTQEYAGTLGPSIRSVVPVLDGGTVVALVSVGITLDRIDAQLRRELPAIVLAALGALAVGLLGAWLISRRLRRQTHGMGEREITRMYEYYRAVLEAVREGLVLIDGDGTVQLVNEEARRLLDLPEDVVGRSLVDLGLPPGLVEAIESDLSESDTLYVLDEQVLVISSAPAYWGGKDVGAVVTLRDRTELQHVTGELDLVRGLTESLRAQNHESANRLHTVVSLIEMGRPETAVELATEDLRIAQDLADRVVGAVHDPVLAALLLGKTSQAAERGIELTVGGDVGSEALPVAARDLVTVVGNLLDNAFDAVSESPERKVSVSIVEDEDRVVVVVGDSGPGVPPEDAERVLERGWSSKATSGRGLGLALVGQVARRHGGTVSVGTSALGGAEFTVSLGGDR
jgi:sensor histidine kinase regulating citrate/malate metabolism